MPKVSTKRQITLPIEQCIEAHIEPGDEIDTYIYNGQITIVKKVAGAAKGVLGHLKADKRISDEQSLQSTIDERH
ncbi:AbrB/MazE/SpoVT family DNA-binding domain-containing protein [Spartinivicinus ruber]|uniref:AbrB/MazE/SpoVT family DNA-binding domain-containing protein n=1 Tax=Spartinivicinus ruber TaxID=2683272 RepID=UPI0013D08C3B|nr:AbrB/MazE/SpoVT family DNA-binding domain-containing protein [Spartinivicinus ruber]